MATELMRVCVKEEKDDFPPGFESFSSVMLKEVKDEGKEEAKIDRGSSITCSTSASPSMIEPVQVQMEVEQTKTKGVTRSRRRRMGVKYSACDNSSEDDIVCEKNLCPAPTPTPMPSLPKGVIRGCPECNDCQKVLARWRPDNASRPDLEDAPVFYPTEEEFGDTLKYIASIKPTAEKYGICRIVPPPSWKPPCPLKDSSIWKSSKFATRVQRVDKLQNRNSMRKIPQNNNQMRKKRRKCSRTGVDSAQGQSTSNLCLPGDSMIMAETFGFEPGPQFTLESFEKYADEFKKEYFRQSISVDDMDNSIVVLQSNSEPSLDDIEGEYWRIVEKPTDEIEVLYGADLETGTFGSGFPKESDPSSSVSTGCYTKSGWNLNNFPRLPGSVLTFESGDISGVLVPWLYIGMCFSSFCWHVEDHHLYSLNYMHWGSPKMWYGVSGKDATKLESAMKKHLPDLFAEQPDLLHKLVTQLSPSILKSEGVPAYRCIQNAGEFVLTFPRAYHAGFNTGFNCAEAVNVAPVDWLPHGQIAIELYRSQGRKTSISHDKLLLGAAREAVRAQWEINLLKKNTPDNLRWIDVCGKDGILAKTFKDRVEIERARRVSHCSSARAMKMESNFDTLCERECSICFFDLHLSATGCGCSPDRYACLEHAKQLCPCAWASKYFLFRYNVEELSTLVDALEAKLSATYKWAKLDLGLSLTSHPTEGNTVKDPKTQSSISFIKDLLLKTLSKNTTNVPGLSQSSPAKKVENHGSCTILLEECAVKKKPSIVGKSEVILLSDDEDGDEKATPNVSAISSGISVKQNAKSVQNEGDSSNCEQLGSFSPPSGQKTVPQSSDVSSQDLANGLSPMQVDLDDANLQPSEEKVVVPQPNDQNVGNSETNPPLIAVHINSAASEIANTPDSSNTKEMVSDTVVNSDTASSVEHPSPHCGGEKSSDDDERPEKSGTVATSDVVDSGRNVAGTSSSTQNNLDRYFRQKGPRIAKVVRRINCNVEPLEYGAVLSGKLWSSSQAIFPKGFKSRVRYFNVLEPTSMCYYISEILDAKQAGPLFKVSVEHSPNEVFIHVSPTKCWEMVRERVNQEIARQHRLGKSNLPPLLPPGSLDGFEMFGFSSPAIVQLIEGMDRNRVCINYWNSRPYSRAQVDTSNRKDKEQESNTESAGNHALPLELDTILKRIFNKADLEELQTLHSALARNSSILDGTLMTRLLDEEILKRPW